MADTVDTIVVFNGQIRIGVRLYCKSDGTGETDVIKITKSTLVNSLGVEPASLDLEEVWWSINGFSSVQMQWDHTADDEIVILAQGNGFQSYAEKGNLRDPRSAGGTGNILLTSSGAVSGASYNLFLVFKKT